MLKRANTDDLERLMSIAAGKKNIQHMNKAHPIMISTGPVTTLAIGHLGISVFNLFI